MKFTTSAETILNDYPEVKNRITKKLTYFIKRIEANKVYNQKTGKFSRINNVIMLSDGRIYTFIRGHNKYGENYLYELCKVDDRIERTSHYRTLGRDILLSNGSSIENFVANQNRLIDSLIETYGHGNISIKGLMNNASVMAYHIFD